MIYSGKMPVWRPQAAVNIQKYPRGALRLPTGRAAGSKSACGPFAIRRAAKDAISYIGGLGYCIFVLR